MNDGLLTRTQAVERVLELRDDWVSARSTETVPVSALDGRTLAEPVVPSADGPVHDTATMDGYAVDATVPGPHTRQAGPVAPEDDPPTMAPGMAVAVATGAPLPAGANAVCKREDAVVDGETVDVGDLAPGTHVFQRGANVRAGETVIEAGRRLTPTDAALLADLGRESVSVHRPPEAAVLATGTEIAEGRQADRDSAMLVGLLEAWGASTTHDGAVRDDQAAVRDRIDALATDADLVVTSGGTSKGAKDHVVDALATLGEIVFHGVAVRPGKPVAVARVPDHDALAVAVPGKPVAAHTAATLLLRPLLLGSTRRATVQATVARDLSMRPEPMDYVVPVSLSGQAPTAMPMGHVDSPLALFEETFEPSVLSSCTRALTADGFVVTDAPLRSGDTVDVVPYETVQ